MAQPHLSPSSRLEDRWLSGLFLLALLALPVVGLVDGPLYAAVVFSLGGALALHEAIVERRSPMPDRRLLVLALAFAALGWTTVLWSIVPGHSCEAALQLTAILAGTLVVLGNRLPDERTCRALFRALPFAIALGICVLIADRALRSGWGSWFSADITKYNRGLDYLVLIAWPTLAWPIAERRWRAAATVAGLMLIAVSVGVSTTGTVALVAGAILLVLAIALKDAIAPCLFIVITVLAVAQPLILRLLASHRHGLEPYVKYSGFHRLEVWDYMSSRVLERPLSGWGLLSSGAVPIRPEELAGYSIVKGVGIYPHNQWLQLWLETGLPGIALALAFVAVVLSNIRRTLPPRLRPFAFATLGSALTISLLNFEFATDSWWAALAASALLFKALAGPNEIGPCHKTGNQGASGEAPDQVVASV